MNFGDDTSLTNTDMKYEKQNKSAALGTDATTVKNGNLKKIVDILLLMDEG